MLIKSIYVFAAGLALTAPAHAIPIVFTGGDDGVTSLAQMVNSQAARASFDAAVGPLTVGDFESGLPSGLASVDNGVITNNSGCGALCGIATSGTQFVLRASGSINAVTFNFVPGINAFGMYVTGLQTDLVAQQFVTYTSGLTEIINMPSAINGGGAFVGFLDLASTIASVTYIRNGDIIAFDDLVFGTVSVPEPGTLALLGIGLLGMELARRKKI